jgi:hypothetical protein
MGYTVTGPAATKDAEFESYSQQLRWQGKQLGNLSRVPDPENPTRRWVCYFDTREEAQQFADNLINEHPGDTPWRVVPTDGPPSQGAFGPIRFQLRRWGGMYLVAFDLSLVVIDEAYPNATRCASEVFINTETWNNFRKKQRTLGDLVSEILPLLTGLELEQLTDLGYAIIDADTHDTTIHVPPASLSQVPARAAV